TNFITLAKNAHHIMPIHFKSYDECLFHIHGYLFATQQTKLNNIVIALDKLDPFLEQGQDRTLDIIKTLQIFLQLLSEFINDKFENSTVQAILVREIIVEQSF